MDRSGGVHSGPIRKPSVSGSNSRKSLANFITVSREISRRRYGSSRNWGQMSKSCQSGHGTLAHTLGRLAQQRHTINAEKRGSTARQAVTTLSERQCNGLVGARRKLLRKIKLAGRRRIETHDNEQQQQQNCSSNNNNNARKQVASWLLHRHQVSTGGGELSRQNGR